MCDQARVLGFVLEVIRNARARPLVVGALPVAQQAGRVRFQNGDEVLSARNTGNQCITRFISLHAVDRRGHRDMDMQAAQHIAPPDDLEILDQLAIARLRRFDLRSPGRQRMGSRRGQAKVLVGRDLGDTAPQARQFLGRLLVALEHGRHDLDLRAQQFGRHGIAEPALARAQQRARHDGGQRSRCRMGEEELLFDAEREGKLLQIVQCVGLRGDSGRVSQGAVVAGPPRAAWHRT